MKFQRIFGEIVTVRATTAQKQNLFVFMRYCHEAEDFDIAADGMLVPEEFEQLLQDVAAQIPGDETLVLARDGFAQNHRLLGNAPYHMQGHENFGVPHEIFVQIKQEIGEVFELSYTAASQSTADVARRSSITAPTRDRFI